MKEYWINLEGIWSYTNCIKANSKEEAIKLAMQDMDRESGCIYLGHINQWFEDEEEERKGGEIYTMRRESRSIILTPADNYY
jgi:hypothetical protein